jgi:hypothetical protein
MFRHLFVVPLSALFGSFGGTVIWVAYEGGTGAPDPVGFFIGIAATTLMFTVPGAALLMAATFVLAERGFRPHRAFVALIMLGSFVGAAMLALFSSYFMALGAAYGCLTAVAFVSMLWIFGAYPSNQNPGWMPGVGSHSRARLIGVVAILASIALFTTGMWLLT